MEAVFGTLLIASFLGYVWIWQKIVPAAAAPLCAGGALTLGLYISGLAGGLNLFANIALFIGLAMLVWMLIKRDKGLLRWELGMFAVGCALLAWRYNAALLTAYDDFSHWGTIARCMLINNRFPGIQDVLITFQSYPPASACWVYYICRYLGSSDGTMLWAQAILTLTGWLPLLALIRTRKCLPLLAPTVFLILVGLSLFQGTASLMVDNLVAAMAVGILCVLWLQKDKGSKWICGLLFAVLSLIKDSGLFFVFVLVALSIIITIRQNNAKKGRLKEIAILLSPTLAVRTAWLIHIKTAFTDADVSRHALTVENLRKSGADKSYADMLTIGKNLLRVAIDFKSLTLQVLIVISILTLGVLICRRLKTKQWKPGYECAVLAASVAVYAGWIICLWAMYVFSMPLQSSLSLAAFERYNSTCALFLYGVLALWLLTLPTRARFEPLLAAMILCLPLLSGTWTSGIERLFKENYSVPIRNRMEVLAQLRPVKPDEKAAVLVDAGDEEFASYMARYVFWTPNISALSEWTNDAAQVLYVATEDQQTLPENVQLVIYREQR